MELLPVIYNITSSKLHKLIDTLSSNMKALDALEQILHVLESFLFCIGCTKIDSETLKEWKVKSLNNKLLLVSKITYLFSKSRTASTSAPSFIRKPPYGMDLLMIQPYTLVSVQR